MCNTGNKIVICQLQDAKSDTFTFSRNHCFNSSFKIRFQEPFWVKVIGTKKYTTCT